MLSRKYCHSVNCSHTVDATLIAKWFHSIFFNLIWWFMNLHARIVWLRRVVSFLYFMNTEFRFGFLYFLSFCIEFLKDCVTELKLSFLLPLWVVTFAWSSWISKAYICTNSISTQKPYNMECTLYNDEEQMQNFEKLLHKNFYMCV